MKKKWIQIITILGTIGLFTTGCNNVQTSDKTKEFLNPVILYEGKQYGSGYDDSYLLEKLPKGFREVGSVEGVEKDVYTVPEKEAYASAMAQQIRGVGKGTKIYANRRIPTYIMTEDHGQYVVYSTKGLEEMNFSDFLGGVQLKASVEKMKIGDRTEIVSSSLTQEMLDNSLLTGESVVFHNQGKELKNNFYQEDDAEEKKLLAIRCSKNNGIQYETSYFSQSELTKNALKEYLEEGETELADITGLNLHKGDLVKRGYWVFKKEGIEQARLATAAVLTRLSSQSNMDGEDCSVWVVQMGSSLKKGEAKHIKSQEVTLDTNVVGQTLMEYGYLKSFKSQESETANLDFYDLESSPKEEGGFKVENNSKKSEGLAYWQFNRRLWGSDDLMVNPVAKIANTEGNLELSFQYQIAVEPQDAAIFQKPVKYSTGLLKFSVADR